jgi:LysM repeat protein
MAFGHFTAAAKQKRATLLPGGGAMQTRRLLFLLGLNALVSVTATLAVLWVWDRAHASAPRPAPASSTPGSALPPAPTNTPAPPPTPTATVHVVQPGDTLGSIALQYDVPVAELMAANGLTDPDTLAVGQMLLIPINGYPLVTASPPAL